MKDEIVIDGVTYVKKDCVMVEEPKIVKVEKPKIDPNKFSLEFDPLTQRMGVLYKLDDTWKMYLGGFHIVTGVYVPGLCLPKDQGFALDELGRVVIA